MLKYAKQPSHHERQDPIAGIIAPLRHEINRHAPTRAAPMLQQRIRQRPNRPEVDGRPRRHLLRKHTDAAFADLPPEAKCTARAHGARCAAFGARAGAGACGNGTSDSDGLGLRDADYVVAVAVGEGVGVGVGPDGVAEGLDDCF